MNALTLMALIFGCLKMGRANPVSWQCDLKPLEDSKLVVMARNNPIIKGCVGKFTNREVYVLNAILDAEKILELHVSRSSEEESSEYPVLIVNTKAYLTINTTATIPVTLHYSGTDTVHGYPDSWTLTTVPYAESENLLQWAKEQYGEVTFFAELKDLSKFLLKMEKSKTGPESCVLQENFSFADMLTVESEVKDIESCKVQSPNPKDEKHTYIVEVTSSRHKTISIEVKNSEPVCDKVPLFFLKGEQDYVWNIQSVKDIAVEASGNFTLREFTINGALKAHDDLLRKALDKHSTSITRIRVSDATSLTFTLPCGDQPTTPPSMHNCLSSMGKWWKCTDEYLVITIELERPMCPYLQPNDLYLGTNSDCSSKQSGNSLVLISSKDKCQTFAYNGTLINTLTIKGGPQEEHIPIRCEIPNIQIELSQSSDFNVTTNTVEPAKLFYVRTSVNMPKNNAKHTPLVTKCSLLMEKTEQVFQPSFPSYVNDRLVWTYSSRVSVTKSPSSGKLTCVYCLTDQMSSEDCSAHDQMQKSVEIIIASPTQQQGLGMAFILGITSGAFLIGALLTAALWYIYTHTRSSVKMQPVPTLTGGSESGSTNHSIDSTQSTPCSTSSRA